jgi:hypothetical protein
MQKPCGQGVRVYSEWVRIDPVKGSVIDHEAISEPGEALLSQDGAPVHLEAAANEYVSFQVHVTTESPVQRIDFDFAGLTAPGGPRLGRGEFEAYAQWYHDLGASVGWVPDALVPLARLNEPVGVPWKQVAIPKQTTQGFWIDLFVPRDTPAGRYTGHLSVLCDGQATAIPLALDIWPFAIPDTCSQIADMNAYAPGVSGGWQDLASGKVGIDSAAYLSAEKHTFRAAHEHRSLYHSLPYGHSGRIKHPTLVPELAGRGQNIRVKSWSKFDRHVGPYLDGSAFQGTRRGAIPVPYFYTPHNFDWPADFVNFRHKGYVTEWRRIGREFVDHCNAMGWTQTKLELFFNHKQRWKYFPYDGDEIRFLEDTEHMYFYRDISRGIYDQAGKAQFVWRIDSSWVFPEHGKTDLTDFAKLWVVNQGCIAEGRENVVPMRRKGCKIFHYGGGSRLEAPLSWVWMWPLKTLARGLDGFTWWLATNWRPNIWTTSGDNYATTLFFPGTPWNSREVVGGIRAKVLRNAMQTIEYAYLLDGTRKTGDAMRLVNRTWNTNANFWWESGRPQSGSDAAALDLRRLADPLSWITVRNRLAKAVCKAQVKG